jgi:hypothetical protein
LAEGLNRKVLIPDNLKVKVLIAGRLEHFRQKPQVLRLRHCSAMTSLRMTILISLHVYVSILEDGGELIGKCMLLLINEL